MPGLEEFARKLAVWAIPVLFAITLHEASHGYVARRYGDRTAEMLGRLTLNPIKHIDPVGTVLVPAAMLLLTGFIFGWAKPVPVNTRNLRNPRRDMVIVAAAGPLSNVVMALGWGLLMSLSLAFGQALGSTAHWLFAMGQAGITINAILAVFNLLPIPPLDGGRVASGLLPVRMSDRLDAIEPYGIFIVLGLLFLGILWPLLLPAIEALQIFVYTVTGVAAG
ncbi:MAG TPA: site-2 protease family protein [Gammaproteobacteria bacterium]|nr:site-2 protease family protein [Gammaproteobacteria bacterium]